MKDNCNKNCSICNGTELPNISDAKEINIGYSYAYKTDCAGDRYIKAEEVKYLLKCERNKAIDEFASELENHSIYADIGKGDEVKMEWASPVTRINEIAEQLKAGEMNNEKIMCKDCEHFRIEKPDKCNEGHAYCLKYNLSTMLIGKQYNRKIDRLECYKNEIENAEQLKERD